MGEAKAGSGSLNSILKKTNPALLEQVKAAESNEAAFELMIGGLRGVSDENTRAAIAAAAFSRSGIKLANIANQGADAIAGQRQEVRDYGIISNEALKRSEEFADAQTNVGKIVAGLGLTIGNVLLPEVLKMMKQFQEWFKVNKEILKVKVVQFAKDLAEAIRGLGEFFTETLPKINAFLKPLGGLKAIAVLLAAVLAGPLISAVVALGAALLLTPIGQVSLLIAGLAAGVVWLAGKITEFLPEWIGMWEDTRASFFQWVEDISKMWDNFWDGLIANAIQSVREIAANLTNIFPDFVKDQIGLNVSSTQTINRNTLQTIDHNASDSALADKIAAAVNRSGGNGKLDITINSEGRPRVTRMEDNGLPFNTDVGLAFGP